MDMNNPNNANPQQQPNKRKPKGQMSHTLGPNNPGNKNFPGPGPINNFPTGGQNPNLNLNLNINQMQQIPHQNFAQSPNIPYNQRNMEGRQVPVPGLDPQQNQQQRIQGNKFNRNPERSFTDNPSQRGLGSPNAGGFQQPPLKNTPSMPDDVMKVQNDGEKAPENIKMVKGGRPQQQQQYQQQQQQQYQQYQQQKYQNQQGPGNSNIMFTPNSPYTDQRGMISSPQGPNPGMFNVNPIPPHFAQHQQQMNMPVNMSMMPPNLVPPNMGGQPNHFNFSPGLPMNRNQQQQMGKQQPMQPMFVFPNGIQRNMSMGSEPPMYYINLTDPIQKENSELQANYQSMCKEMTRQMKDIDKTVRNWEKGMFISCFILEY